MAIDKRTQLPPTAVPGREMTTLAAFYKDATWTGKIRAGGMGPGSPEMIGRGSAHCRLIHGGLWYDCDFEQDQYLTDGKFVLRWQLHWISGWDPKARPGPGGAYGVLGRDAGPVRRGARRPSLVADGCW